MSLTKTDELVMKLLHYFITEEGYNPIVLHGAKDEIWLENLNSPYKIIRIVSNYIHNEEQFDNDIYRTKQIMKRIKKKTLSMKMNALSIFINLGDSVHLEEHEQEEFGNVNCVGIKSLEDFKQYQFVIENFPTITKKTKFKEDGMALFMKITRDINKKNQVEAKHAEDVFKMKKPIITYIFIALNVIMYLLTVYNEDILYALANNPASILGGEYYRLLTSAFIHADIFHILLNMYALYVIGPQIESFFGKARYIFIYLISAFTGNLLSMLFLGSNTVSLGASGAIFGLLGSLLYFGYHYRVYLGNVMKSQVIPIVLLNLCMGFLPGIDMSSHIGGMIGGIISSMAIGIKYKTSKFERMNGWIMLAIFTGFLIYLGFFR